MPQKIQLKTPYSLHDSPADSGVEPKKPFSAGSAFILLLDTFASFIGVLSTFAAVLCLAAPTTAAPTHTRIAAKVGQQPVYVNDVLRRLQMLRTKLEIPSQILPQLHAETLEQIIRQRLVQIHLKRLGKTADRQTIEDAMKKVVTIPGPEIDQLAEIAQQYGLYLCGGGVMEKIPEFPDRWFNSNFIIGPSGDVVLKYHKWHIPAYIGLGTSPHDLFDEYCDKLGGDIKDLFPVIDTEIGKLGTMTCHDGCTPEVSRALGYNGAEVI